MEYKEKEGQAVKKPDVKIIDYIDDRGDRRRIYTTNATVEAYIKNTYCVIENRPQAAEDLTP